MSDLRQWSAVVISTDNSWAENSGIERTEPGSSAQQVTAAQWAVAEYLRDIGLRDPELIARESHDIVTRAQCKVGENGEERSLAEAAIQLTVKQLDQWLAALAADPHQSNAPNRPNVVAGARLPDLLSRYPSAWRNSRPSAEAIETAREDLRPVVPRPRPRPMHPQTLALVPWSLKRLRCRMERLFGRDTRLQDSGPGDVAPKESFSGQTVIRRALALLTILSTSLSTWLFYCIAVEDGLGVLGIILTMLFATLFVCVVFSFWTATFGLIVRLRRGGFPCRAAEEVPHLPPTAIVMPIYNENPRVVFSNIRAIAMSLHATGGDGFNIFVLSDTTDPNIWLEEEREWSKLVAELPVECSAYYRRRLKNTSRKAGNIADFCIRWGDRHKYMIVLDADSVMAGETLVEMVRRMERDPRLGILQVPPRPVNRHSFFARLQQFAAYVYGPVFLEGFALWSQCDGNYWGHNAIIRIAPFMKHCTLPVLPGDGPLGGEILSHDFVEAALMRRADWKVCIAHDLDGSYEQCPTTIVGFAKRDQRWCQGNLQHVRLLLAEGLHPASRLHLGMGAMSFLTSPLWLALLVLTVIGATYQSGFPAQGLHAPGAIVLFAITMLLLLLPKIWGVIASLWDSQYSGRRTIRVIGSVFIETVASTLLAPIMMVLHSRFVILTLLGKKVAWRAQERDDCGVSLRAAAAMHFTHSLAGLAAAGLTWLWAPSLLLWLLPVISGLVLSIPLAMLLGSVRVGKLLARHGLLTIPEEVALPSVLKYQSETRNCIAPEPKGHAESTDVFTAVIQDPAFYALHVGILNPSYAAAHKSFTAADLRRSSLH